MCTLDEIPISIMDDIREIKSVWAIDQEGFDTAGTTVGQKGVTRITAYTEKGQMNDVVWFKVWKVDRIDKRLNGAHMAEVTYLEGPA